MSMLKYPQIIHETTLKRTDGTITCLHRIHRCEWEEVYEQDTSHQTEMNVITVKSASQHFIFVYPSLYVRLTDMIFIRYDSVTSSVSDFKI